MSPTISLRPRVCSAFLAVSLLTSSFLPAEESPAQSAGWRLVPYGTEVPTLSCSPLGACMIALEEGEQIESRFLADSARWEVEPGSTGAIPLVAVKPRECGIASNLYLSTDRRIYTLLLLSPACDPAHLNDPAGIKFDQIRYTYPGQFRRLWQPTAPADPSAIHTSARSVADLNFSYRWSAGRRAVEPRIVYDDGSRTYLVLDRMDPALHTPAVFVKGENGQLEAVNFAAPLPGGTTYTVDRIADELVLVSGPARAEKTTIRRERRR